MADFDYYGALGVAAPETSSSDPAPAETGANDKSGVSVQDTAAPETEGTNAETAAETGGADREADAGEGDAEEKPRQSREEDARYAAARREAERQRDEAVRKAKAEADATIDEVIAGLKVRDPDTQQIITTKARYDEVIKRRAGSIVDGALKKVGLDRDALDAVISEHPVVKEAGAAVAEAQRAKLAAEQEKANAVAAEQLKTLAELNPSLRTLDDLAKMPDYDRFYDLVVRKGNSFIEAYWALHGPELLAARENGAARQQAINAVSKNHLTRTTQSASASDEAAVTPGDVDAFRALFPGMTADEIAGAKRRYLKSIRAGSH